MNLNEPIFTLATKDELRDLVLLGVIEFIADDMLRDLESDDVYDSVLNDVVVNIENSADVINDMCEWRANRIVRLCQTGQ